MAKKSILVIGDAHAKPGVSNERFTWLGKWAREKRPDIIVDMGDWADMPSLSSYDYGTKCYEGRRYYKDVEAATDARTRFNDAISSPLEDVGSRVANDYNPTKIALGGNHDEGRILKAIESDPKLSGTIGVRDLGHEAQGWDYVPFREPVTIQGFHFCHYLASGVMGRPISGETPSLSLIRKTLVSSVVGHSHLMEIAHRTQPSGKRVWGIVAGCFLAENQWESYAHQANRLWWKGAILLRGADKGDFDSMETISVKELRAMYGRERG